MRLVEDISLFRERLGHLYRVMGYTNANYLALYFLEKWRHREFLLKERGTFVDPPIGGIALVREFLWLVPT